MMLLMLSVTVLMELALMPWVSRFAAAASAAPFDTSPQPTIAAPHPFPAMPAGVRWRDDLLPGRLLEIGRAHV